MNRLCSTFFGLLLLLTTGCAYLADRGADLADLMPLELSYGVGLHVEANATSWLGIGAGGASIERVSLTRDGLSKRHEYSLGLPCTAALWGLEFSAQQGVPYPDFQVDTTRMLDTGNNRGLDISVGATCGVAGLRLNFPTWQWLDFIGGIFGLDIGNDDRSGEVDRMLWDTGVAGRWLAGVSHVHLQPNANKTPLTLAQLGPELAARDLDFAILADYVWNPQNLIPLAVQAEEIREERARLGRDDSPLIIGGAEVGLQPFGQHFGIYGPALASLVEQQGAAEWIFSAPLGGERGSGPLKVINHPYLQFPSIPLFPGLDGSWSGDEKRGLPIGDGRWQRVCLKGKKKWPLTLQIDRCVGGESDHLYRVSAGPKAPVWKSGEALIRAYSRILGQSKLLDHLSLALTEEGKTKVFGGSFTASPREHPDAIRYGLTWSERMKEIGVPQGGFAGKGRKGRLQVNGREISQHLYRLNPWVVADYNCPEWTGLTLPNLEQALEIVALRAAFFPRVDFPYRSPNIIVRLALGKATLTAILCYAVNDYIGAIVDAGYDGIEAFHLPTALLDNVYGRNGARSGLERALARIDGDILRRKVRLRAFAGLDNHHPFDPLLRPLMYVHAAEKSPEALHRALEQGRIVLLGLSAGSFRARGDGQERWQMIGANVLATERVELRWCGRAVLFVDGQSVGTRHGGYIHRIKPGSFHFYRIVCNGSYSNSIYCNLPD